MELPPRTDAWDWSSQAGLGSLGTYPPGTPRCFLALTWGLRTPKSPHSPMYNCLSDRHASPEPALPDPPIPPHPRFLTQPPTLRVAAAVDRANSRMCLFHPAVIPTVHAYERRGWAAPTPRQEPDSSRQSQCSRQLPGCPQPGWRVARAEQPDDVSRCPSPPHTCGPPVPGASSPQRPDQGQSGSRFLQDEDARRPSPSVPQWVVRTLQARGRQPGLRGRVCTRPGKGSPAARRAGRT